MDDSALTGLAAGTIALGEVTTLNHEVLDNTVESRPLVPEALLAGSQSTEVLGRLGHRLAIQSKNDTAEVLIAVLDVEVDLVGDLGAFGRGDGGAEEQHAHADEQRGRDEKPPEVEHCGWRGLVTCQLRLVGWWEVLKMGEIERSRALGVSLRGEALVVCRQNRSRETRFTKLEVGDVYTTTPGGTATCMKLERCNSRPRWWTPPLQVSPDLLDRSLRELGQGVPPGCFSAKTRPCVHSKCCSWQIALLGARSLGPAP